MRGIFAKLGVKLEAVACVATRCMKTLASPSSFLPRHDCTVLLLAEQKMQNQCMSLEAYMIATLASLALTCMVMECGPFRRSMLSVTHA